MQTLNFKSAFARNFACFGPDGIQLDFTKYDKIVHVTGINRDNITDGDDEPSNASGKSSLQDILTFGLTGRISKEPKKMNLSDLVHDKYPDETAEIIVEFDNVKVRRTINPTSITIWEDGVNITPGGKGEPQKWLDKRTGMSHSAWCQIAIFSDTNDNSFLELDAAGKRDLIENLLGLEKYRAYVKTAKEMLTAAESKVSEYTKDYARLQNEIDALDKRIVQIKQQEVDWKAKRIEEEGTLRNKLNTKEKELLASDIGPAMREWQKAQDDAKVLAEALATAGERRQKVVAMVTEAEKKIEESRSALTAILGSVNDYTVKLSSLKGEFGQAQILIGSLNKLQDGQQCSACHGVISPENYVHALSTAQETVDKLGPEIIKVEEELALWKEKRKQRDDSISKLETHVKTTKPKLDAFDKKVAADQNELNRLVQLRKPDATSSQKVLETQISELKTQITAKQQELLGVTPYAVILASAEQEKLEKITECEEKSVELRKAEKEVPYYEYWVKAFGDKGIRRYVVDGIIPALNARIAYWLQYLIGGRIEVTFDNELDVKILRNGVDAHYYACSNGEKRRINLAVSQAFAYVMMLNSGRCPSIVFLDEVTGGGIDLAGVTGVYNMIFELAKERQVFVTTHNQKLLNMLGGCQTLTLVKENDVSRLHS